MTGFTALDAEVREGLKKTEEQEEILKDNPGRWVILPIHYPRVWDMFKRQELSFWTAEDLQYSVDGEQVAAGAVPAQLLKYLKRLVVFNAISNGSVYDNMYERSSKLLVDVQLPEARAFYGFQIAMEHIHAEANYHLVETYIPDAVQREEMADALLKVGVVSEKGAFVRGHMHEEAPFAERAAATAVAKQIFTAGAHALAAALKAHGLCPALTKGSAHIGRDERLQGTFSELLYGMLEHKLPEQQAQNMIREAVDMEKRFVSQLVNIEAFGVETATVHAFIEYQGDRVLHGLGHQTIFGTPCPPALIALSEEHDKEELDALKPKGGKAQKSAEQAREAFEKEHESHEAPAAGEGSPTNKGFTLEAEF